MMQTQCGVPGIDYGWRSKIRFKDNWRFSVLSEVMSVPNIKLEYKNQEMNKKDITIPNIYLEYPYHYGLNSLSVLSLF